MIAVVYLERSPPAVVYSGGEESLSQFTLNPELDVEARHWEND